MSRIITPGNGAGEPIVLEQQDPFQQLGNAIMQLASARDKREATARLANCQRLVAAVRAGFLENAMAGGRLIRLLQQETGGELWCVRIAPLDGAKSFRLEDANEKPISVVDVAEGLILVRPDHVQPIKVRHQFPDDRPDSIEEIPEVNLKQWEQLGGQDGKA